MGNSVSVYNEKNIFQKELASMNDIVNNIINEKNVFVNRDYNFLSQDVCNQHYIMMESELNRHLRVEVANLGSALYLVPKESDATYQRLNINKKEICKRITQHYIKILYILCLIKYVYNIENHGDFSISGIVFRNIKIVDGIMEINFCNVPQKDYSKSIKDAYKLDFSRLEGLKFLAEFFLDKQESMSFIKVMRRVLARSAKKDVQQGICSYVTTTGASVEHVKQLEKIYYDKFNEKLACVKQNSNTKPDQGTVHTQKQNINLFMYVEKDNPILAKEYCHEMHKYVIQINTPGGKAVLQQYNKMRENYVQNLRSVESLLGLLVIKNKDNSYSLKDVNKDELDNIIYRVKDVIKTYYIQSILDYQKLLDVGKNSPNINIIK